MKKIEKNIYSYSSKKGVVYVVRYSAGGINHSKNFDTYQSAVDYLSSIKSKASYEGLKLSELSKMFISYRGNREYSPSTIYRYGITHNILIDILGDKRIIDLDYNDYQLLVNHLKSKPTGIVNKNRYLCDFRLLINYAFEKLKIDTPLYGMIDLIRVKHNDLYTVLNKKDYFTKSEVEQLISSADETTRLIIQLMYFQGLRPEELRGLKAGDIMEDDTIILSRAISSKCGLGKWQVIPLKTLSSYRILVYPENVIKGLKSYVARNLLSRDCFLFSVSPDHSTPLGDMTLTRRLKAVANRCGIKVARPHMFRHSIAEHMLEQGYSDDDIARFVGHSSKRTTQRYYFSKSVDKKREMLQKITQPK